jgi:hypothetical protein
VNALRKAFGTAAAIAAVALGAALAIPASASAAPTASGSAVASPLIGAVPSTHTATAQTLLYQHITNINSGLCLNVARASTADNAPVIQYTCQNTFTNDRWAAVTNPNGYFWIKNENSGLCLNVAGASTADNAPVIQYTCQSRFLNESWSRVIPS